MTHTVVTSPIGPLTLVATDGVLSGLYMDSQLYLPDITTFGAEEPDCLPEAREQLRAYFDGELTAFTLAVAPRGTPFQQRCWAQLQQIPYGETWTYRELAERIGRPTAARAVGMANGHNPISIVIPCHRLVGTNGSLTGYGGGVQRKQALLDLERGRRPRG
ncbi:methylated-DNA--[protein]-cysteine S-methyltransferase [Pseudonocardia sp. GCM10023141]|uniref:methylated-DNA--[protein]-cysteine S-methyltransferase n=1 Tax=Pseudonocardia sp. GCM10023141 TaxID=3252653 RepID=UPI0036225BAB